jgi:hypothetical protein
MAPPIKTIRFKKITPPLMLSNVPLLGFQKMVAMK